MEAVPRLPMISFELKTSPENPSFGPPLKEYIASFYGEDPESYGAEIHKLECLRNAAVHPSKDVTGVQILKKYYCQLHFLKSRFPMEESDPVQVGFPWKDNYSGVFTREHNIQFELMCVLYNIGALHSQLGATDSRSTPEGMKMACTHFQCAAWAFQSVKENYTPMVHLVLAPKIIDYMQQVCLAQAQECILEKSMLDNRKATIIAKVAVQVVDYYKQALQTVQGGTEEGPFSDVLSSRICKDWVKYLSFKVSYYKCIALLYQGQQAEELQKMGERVAFYQLACEQLEEARKLGANISHQQEIGEALAFTLDVVEGKRKAAKNENEFIYHEDVPDKDVLQEVKGASLVKGIPFNVNDFEVSEGDIFARLVPMEAHEASSLYSERKAHMLRQFGEMIESKDQALAEFMSSLKLDFLVQMKQASGLSQDLVDRAAALSARPSAMKDLVNAMSKLSNSYHEVEAMLNEIQELLKEEEQNEKEYQVVMGKRPPSIVATDLAREAAKYREAHNKASESNQNLHKAMTSHIANLKILAQPMTQLNKQIPSIELPNANLDEQSLKELESLRDKVEEMKNQRAMLWNQLREAIHQDDITGALVTRQPNQPLDNIFQKELEKHQKLGALLEQNIAAQENITKALVEAYAHFADGRRYIQEILNQRATTVAALIQSYDSYEDLLGKANKGIEFYGKLETNVLKLLQRIRGACKVQEEEREQMLAKSGGAKSEPAVTTTASATVPTAAPKLKDYLDSMKKEGGGVVSPLPYSYSVANSNGMTNKLEQTWPPAIRPAPLGSEMDSEQPGVLKNNEQQPKYGLPGGNNAFQLQQQQYAYQQQHGYSQHPQPNVYGYQDNYQANYANNYQLTSGQGAPPAFNALNVLSQPANNAPDQTEADLSKRLAALMPGGNKNVPENQQQQNPYNYNTQTYHTYSAANYSYPSTSQGGATSTTILYQPISSPYPNNNDNNMVGYAVGYPQNYQAPATMDSGLYLHQKDSLATPAMAPQEMVASSAANGAQQQYIPQVSVNYSGAYDSLSHANYPYTAVGYQYSLDVANSTPYSTDPYGYNTLDTNYQAAAGVAPTNIQYGGQQQEYQAPPANNADPASYGYYGAANNVPGPDNPYYSYYGNYSNGNAPNYVNNSAQAHTFVTSAVNNQPTLATSQAAEISDKQLSTTDLGMMSPGNVPIYAGGFVPPAPIQNFAPSTPEFANNQQQQQQPPTTGVADKTPSTIDLLSGLDFSISEAPLIPEKKPAKAKEKQPASNASPKSTTASAVTKKPEAAVVREAPPAFKEIVKLPTKNHFGDPEVAKAFLQEVEKFEKFVDSLTVKTLNGPTTLEVKWKEVQDRQDADCHKKSISVARCYPMKNRFPDILPYDQTRIELRAAKDDYVNASLVKNVSAYTPIFIATQAPTSHTLADFWVMVHEQQVEVIVCMLGDNEFGNDVYWPKERGRDLTVANMIVSLQSLKNKTGWNERIFTINIPEQRETRTILHLQFTAWPGSLFPSPPASLAGFVQEVVAIHQLQRSTSHPVLVHCLSGVGRTGVFCLLMCAFMDVTFNPTCLPDLTSLAVKLSSARKNILRDREHLKFAHLAFLHRLKEIQAKLLGVNSKASQEDPSSSSTTTTPKEEAKTKESDPLSALDPFWASKRQN